MRCGECWSLLYWTVHHERMWLRVPYGTLSEAPTLWFEIRDDLPQHDRYPW